MNAAAGDQIYSCGDHALLSKLSLRNGAHSTYHYDCGSRLTRLVNYHSPYADAGVTRYIAASNDYEYAIGVE